MNRETKMFFGALITSSYEEWEKNETLYHEVSEGKTIFNIFDALVIRCFTEATEEDIRRQYEICCNITHYMADRNTADNWWKLYRDLEKFFSDFTISEYLQSFHLSAEDIYCICGVGQEAFIKSRQEMNRIVEFTEVTEESLAQSRKEAAESGSEMAAIATTLMSAVGSKKALEIGNRMRVRMFVNRVSRKGLELIRSLGQKSALTFIEEHEFELFGGTFKHHQDDDFWYFTEADKDKIKSEVVPIGSAVLDLCEEYGYRLTQAIDDEKPEPRNIRFGEDGYHIIDYRFASLRHLLKDADKIQVRSESYDFGEVEKGGKYTNGEWEEIEIRVGQPVERQFPDEITIYLDYAQKEDNYGLYEFNNSIQGCRCQVFYLYRADRYVERCRDFQEWKAKNS